MKKHIKIISILAFFLILISVSSCELGFKVDKPNIYMISMGCDFGESGADLTKVIDSYGVEHIGSFGHWNNLKYTVNDAVEVGKGFEAIAKKSGYNFKIQYLLGPYKQNSSANYSYDALTKYVSGTPEYENFDKALTSFSDIKSSDILIFYVSSHGGSSKYGNVTLPDDALAFYDCAVSFSLIKNKLKSIGATVVVIADACYSGILIPAENGVVVNPDLSSKNPIKILFKSKIKESAGFYALTADTYYQESFEENENNPSIPTPRHGVFTRGLLNAIGWNDKTKSLGNINALKNNQLTLVGIGKYIYDDVSRSRQQSQVYGGSDDIILFKF